MPVGLSCRSRIAFLSFEIASLLARIAHTGERAQNFSHLAFAGLSSKGAGNTASSTARRIALLLINFHHRLNGRPRRRVLLRLENGFVSAGIEPGATTLQASHFCAELLELRISARISGAHLGAELLEQLGEARDLH